MNGLMDLKDIANHREAGVNMNINDIIRKLNPIRQKKIKQRAKELTREHIRKLISHLNF